MLYVLLLLGYVAAQAQTLNTVAAHLKVNFIDLTWRVNADSTAVYEQAVEREALSQQGAQAATKFVQMYNKTLQRYEVIEAYTLKADGRKIPVEKEGMQILTLPLDSVSHNRDHELACLASHSLSNCIGLT